MNSVHDLARLARLDEARVARAHAQASSEVAPWCGGVMGAGPKGTPANYAGGAGFDGPVSREDVRRLIEFYESRGTEPRIETCPFVHGSLIESLLAEGFGLKIFESVFARPLAGNDPIESPVPTPAGLTIEQVNARDDRAVDEYARTIMSGFHPGGMPVFEEIVGVIAKLAKSGVHRSFLARIEGSAAGGGGLDSCGEVAGMLGASVLPQFRRQGIQLALLVHRLRAARETGAKYAMITGRPGATTERNAQRVGFIPAYTRVVLVRPSPGLAPVLE